MYPQLPAGAVIAPSSDALDVADVARTFRRQWRAVIAFVLLGLLLSGAVVLFAPKKFDGRTTVLARGVGAGGASIAGRMGTGVGDLLGSLGGLATSGTLETELQMLKSQTLAQQVVDSLRLQFRVREPRRVAPSQLIEASNLMDSFERRTYQLTRNTDGTYRATSGDSSWLLVPGQPGRVDIGTITLRPQQRPFERIGLTVLDREESLNRFGKQLTVTKAGGDIAKVVYRGDDSLTAAAAANSLVKFYLDRRKTVDRGLNQRKVEYVTEQLDTTGLELAHTERALRRYQQTSGVIDPEVTGQMEVQSTTLVRRSLMDLQVEEGAIKQLLAQADAGRIGSRELAAYPGFFRGSSVSPLAQQLSDLEAQRIRLLERRTEQDPEVKALDETMLLLQRNIIGMARSYAGGVTRQREQLQARLDSMQRRLMELPVAAEQGGRMMRDVERLTKIYTALGAQLVEAKLAAIDEGGDVRQIDPAFPSREPAFPRPILTMGIGGVGGLVAGMVAALLLGWFGRWLRDPVEIERAVGVSALRFEPNAPLLLAGAASARSLMIVPLGPKARASVAVVAERLALTARQRLLQVNILDLSFHEGNGKSAIEPAQPGSAIQSIERDDALAIVQLPELTSDVTLAALRETRPVILVAPPGLVDRTRLAHAVDTLRRLQVPCAGIVISDSQGRVRNLL